MEGWQSLNETEWSLLLESLNYTKRAFENCKDYPSYHFKQERVQEVITLRTKLQEIKRGIKLA